MHESVAHAAERVATRRAAEAGLDAAHGERNHAPVARALLPRAPSCPPAACVLTLDRCTLHLDTLRLMLALPLPAPHLGVGVGFDFVRAVLKMRHGEKVVIKLSEGATGTCQKQSVANKMNSITQLVIQPYSLKWHGKL